MQFPRIFFLFLSILIFDRGHADVVHVDFASDSVFTGFSSFFLDFDKDGEDDLSFWLFEIPGNSSVQIQTLNGQILGVDTGNGALPQALALDSGEIINDQYQEEYWVDAEGGFIYLGRQDGNVGHWIGAQSKYLAVRFFSGGNCHHAWVKMGVSTGLDSMTIQGYAYNNEEGNGVRAGQVTEAPTDNAPEIQVESATDVGYISQSNIIELELIVPAEVDSSTDLKVFVLPADSLSSFRKCDALSTSNCFTASLNSGSHTMLLPDTMFTVYGGTVECYTPYYIAVLNLANQPLSISPSLSFSSTSIELEKAAASITAINVVEDSLNSEIIVDYSFASDTSDTTILEYYVFAVAVYDTAFFNVDDAKSSSNFISHTHGIDMVVGEIGSEFLDVNGNLLSDTSEYVLVVMSIASGNGATINSLSDFSAPFKVVPVLEIKESALDTPNLWIGDGRLMLSSSETESFYLKVYSSSGQLYYNTSQKTNEWVELFPLPSEMLIYHIEYNRSHFVRKKPF